MVVQNPLPHLSHHPLRQSVPPYPIVHPDKDTISGTHDHQHKQHTTTTTGDNKEEEGSEGGESGSGGKREEGGGEGEGGGGGGGGNFMAGKGKVRTIYTGGSSSMGSIPSTEREKEKLREGEEGLWKHRPKRAKSTPTTPSTPTTATTHTTTATPNTTVVVRNAIYGKQINGGSPRVGFRMGRAGDGGGGGGEGGGGGGGERERASALGHEKEKRTENKLFKMMGAKKMKGKGLNKVKRRSADLCRHKDNKNAHIGAVMFLLAEDKNLRRTKSLNSIQDDEENDSDELPSGGEGEGGGGSGVESGPLQPQEKAPRSGTPRGMGETSGQSKSRSPRRD